MNAPTRAYDFKFGEAGLTDARIGEMREAVGNLSLPIYEIRPGQMPYSTYTNGFGAAYNLSDDLFGNSNTGAFGGFVIYPNKPNTNMMQSVYSK